MDVVDDEGTAAAGDVNVEEEEDEVTHALPLEEAEEELLLLFLLRCCPIKRPQAMQEGGIPSAKYDRNMPRFCPYSLLMSMSSSSSRL